jgi:hypothetical protein
VTVTGTSTPGNTIRIAATNTDENSTTSIFSATVGSGGSFSIPVTLIGGRSVLNIVATSPSGATAREVRTVVVLAASAPVIFEADDPTATTTGRATTATRPPVTSTTARSTSSSSRCSTRATRSPSACGCATSRRRSAARTARS